MAIDVAEPPVPEMAALLEPLAQLRLLGGSQAAYFLTQSKNPDDVIRIGAWIGLMNAYALPDGSIDRLLADCGFEAVRKKAFDYFEKLYEHARASRALAVPHRAGDTQQALMLAKAGRNPQDEVECHVARYLDTGEGIHLASAIWPSERAGGWVAGLQMAIRGFAAQPFNAALLVRVLQNLENSQRTDLIDQMAGLLEASPIHKPIAGIARALSLRLGGDPDSARQLINKLDGNSELREPLAPFQGIMQRSRILSLESLGEYRRVYEASVRLNDILQKSEGVDGRAYFPRVAKYAALKIPSLPGDDRTDVVQMTGFPRSGTTLLENVLAAHPAIETFEEVPAIVASQNYIDRGLSDKRDRPTDDTAFYMNARASYYRELDHYRLKPGATVRIDKMPMQSANAVLLSKLFPSRRYIFSVRHPYDVVLSCFRQRFAPNMAMANFHTIADAARLYDFAMTQWFSVHTLSDVDVKYVRYDQLVTDFQSTCEGILAFLGLEWSDDLLAFSEKAALRPARTPSYEKVRRGLTIGVQSNWRKYDFVFATQATALLRKWAKFFGYEFT